MVVESQASVPSDSGASVGIVHAQTFSSSIVPIVAALPATAPGPARRVRPWTARGISAHARGIETPRAVVLAARRGDALHLRLRRQRPVDPQPEGQAGPRDHHAVVGDAGNR